MGVCVDTAYSVAPPPNATAMHINMSFELAQKGLVNCFRKIVAWQHQAYPWGERQKKSFSNTDQNLWILLMALMNDDF